MQFRKKACTMFKAASINLLLHIEYHNYTTVYNFSFFVFFNCSIQSSLCVICENSGSLMFCKEGNSSSVLLIGFLRQQSSQHATFLWSDLKPRLHDRTSCIQLVIWKFLFHIPCRATRYNLIYIFLKIPIFHWVMQTCWHSLIWVKVKQESVMFSTDSGVVWAVQCFALLEFIVPFVFLISCTLWEVILHNWTKKSQSFLRSNKQVTFEGSWTYDLDSHWLEIKRDKKLYLSSCME